MKGRTRQTVPGLVEIPDTRPPMAALTARTDPFQLLVAEHTILRQQLEWARIAAGQPTARAILLGTLDLFGEALRIHQRREETALYPVCERLFSGPDGVAGVLRDDHSEIAAALTALVAKGPGPSAADMDAFIDRVQRHFAREEHVLFPLMAAMLPGTEASALARKLRGVVAG